MPKRAKLPEVRFNQFLFCPHCGTKLIATDQQDLGLRKCKHLVFAWLWNSCDDDYFMAVRPDFAVEFLPALLGSRHCQNSVADGEVEPLSDPEQAQFLLGDFAPDSPLAAKIASLCPEAPACGFNSTLKPDTVYYVNERGHSGLRVAIDGGS